MEKIRLHKVSVIENLGELVKYTTQIPNIYIYDVRIGRQYQTKIFNDQKDKQSPRFGEKSVVVTHNNYIEGIGLCGGVEYVGYSHGLKNKYYVFPTDK